MSELKERIKEKRPTLSNSSLNTYNSVLKSLHKRVFSEGIIEFDNFDNSDKILSYLKDVEPNKRKTVMSALVIICKDPKPYRSQMLDDIKKTATAKHENTEHQAKHYISQESLHNKYLELKSEADHFYKKKTLTPTDFQKIQDFIIISLFHLVPPRHAMDYTEFKIKNADKEQDNWFDEHVNDLVFTKYKTSKFYGEQRLPVGNELEAILKKWIKINPADYLLVDTNSSKLSTVKLNQRLNRIFGSNKGCSVNALRHSYLSDKYQEPIQIKQDMHVDIQNE